jgi:hypothetical protein
MFGKQEQAKGQERAAELEENTIFGVKTFN